jgi:hypothetical protein
MQTEKWDQPRRKTVKGQGPKIEKSYKKAIRPKRDLSPKKAKAERPR